jgi:hypothetical protein
MALIRTIGLWGDIWNTTVITWSLKFHLISAHDQHKINLGFGYNIDGGKGKLLGFKCFMGTVTKHVMYPLYWRRMPKPEM